jgi:4-hydroxybenzoate polyprenyltransferase
MLWTALLLLVVLWLLGLLLSFGSWIRLFPVLAALLLLYRLTAASRRR